MDYDTENGKNRLSHEAFYLLLIFQKPDGDLFTDVRPQWSQYGNKQKYYEDLIGHQFQIEIKEVSNG
jgi:hypothetical protein